MRLQATLALRELRLHPGRTGLVVAALVLGVWGMGTPLVSSRILTPDLAANFQRTRPPHVILRSDDFSAFDAAAFPEVESATLRDFAVHRVEVAPDKWLPLYLYGVDAFTDAPLGRLTPQQGAATPPPGTVLVERDGLRVATFGVGAAPRISVGGRLGTLPISGVTFDASQAPATQDAFIYAYADRPTWAALTGAPTGHRLAVRLRDVRSAGDVQRVTARLVERLAGAGVQVTSTEVPRFEQHPHQWQLDTLLFLVSAVGALAFAMAAVLVSQLMRAVLAGQVRQVGVLKAVGATRGQVLRVSVMTSMAMGVAAGLLGVPLAALSGRLFSAFVAKTLNFDVLTPGVPHEVLVVLAGASLVLPLLFSLPTLVRGSRLTVKAALRDVGVAPASRAQVAARGWLSPQWRLALRNVLRDRTRLVVTVLSMGVGVAIFETGFNVRASLWQLLSNVSSENRYDVTVVLSGPVERERAFAPFAAVANVERVEAWAGGQGEVQSRVLSTREGVGVVALPRESALLKLELTAGRWLEPSPGLEVVLNQQAWLAYGKPALGDRVDLFVGAQSAPAVVVGLAQQFEKAKLYVDQGDFDARFNPEHRVTTLLFVAQRDGYDEVLKLERDLEQAVASSGLPVLYVMSHAERVRIISEHLDIILVTLLVLSLLVLVVSAIGNAAAAGVDVLQRTRELGVMRAIGATPEVISRLLRREGLVMSTLGIGLGLLLALPLTRTAAGFFGDLMLGDGGRLEPAFSGAGFVVTVSVTFVFSLLASWAPARSALRSPAHQALQQG
ncbi:MAG: FtsX-like permease family protein [Archangium sp.]|nr:FtsX-like permease family protein [Archangium sp.]